MAPTVPASELAGYYPWSLRDHSHAPLGAPQYHNQGDEFLFKGKSYQELNEKLAEVQSLLKTQPFAVQGSDGRITTIPGADFCFGIGTCRVAAELCSAGQPMAAVPT